MNLSELFKQETIEAMLYDEMIGRKLFCIVHQTFASRSLHEDAVDHVITFINTRAVEMKIADIISSPVEQMDVILSAMAHLYGHTVEQLRDLKKDYSGQECLPKHAKRNAARALAEKKYLSALSTNTKGFQHIEPPLEEEPDYVKKSRELQKANGGNTSTGKTEEEMFAPKESAALDAPKPTGKYGARRKKKEVVPAPEEKKEEGSFSEIADGVTVEEGTTPEPETKVPEMDGMFGGASDDKIDKAPLGKYGRKKASTGAKPQKKRTGGITGLFG